MAIHLHYTFFVDFLAVFYVFVWLCCYFGLATEMFVKEEINA